MYLLIYLFYILHVTDYRLLDRRNLPKILKKKSKYIKLKKIALCSCVHALLVKSRRYGNVSPDVTVQVWKFNILSEQRENRSIIRPNLQFMPWQHLVSCECSDAE